MGTHPPLKSTEDEKSTQTEKVAKGSSWAQDKYESAWLYPENHPWRLAQHITLRGVFAGATMGVVGGTGFAALKRRNTFLPSIGKYAFRGALGGGILLGAVAAERHFNLEPIGVEDRAYRIAYNWGQTKWDWIALDGALLGGFLLKRSFGGVLPAASVGIGVATLTCAGSMIFSKLAG